MALINRVARLFKADLNAVLDHIEEPEQLLRQAIRDMEDELASGEQRVALLKHERQVHTARRDEIRVSLDEIGEQLDLCFESGKEDLAKSLVRKKLEFERLHKNLCSTIEANDQHIVQLQKTVDENRVVYESLRQKAELLEKNSCGTRYESNGDDIDRLCADFSVSEDDVEIAFLREQAKRGEA